MGWVWVLTIVLILGAAGGLIYYFTRHGGHRHHDSPWESENIVYADDFSADTSSSVYSQMMSEEGKKYSSKIWQITTLKMNALFQGMKPSNNKILFFSNVGHEH